MKAMLRWLLELAKECPKGFIAILAKFVAGVIRYG